MRNNKFNAEDKSSLSDYKSQNDDKSTNKRSRGNRSGKHQNKKSARRKRNDESLPNATTSNDPIWYGQSPELLRDSASIPFSWPVGTKLINQDWLAPADNVVPGVMTIEMVPSIGTATKVTDPANVAADAIYSFVRHANSGHSNYDAPDLMMYLLAISSVYSFITWCQRLLGTVMVYDQRNRYLPDALIIANKVQPNDLRNNIATFRLWLNTYISKVASFAVPDVMPYFSRMAFLYSNYYTDGPSIKDQLYMYVPYNITFPQFQIDTESGLGKLHYATIQTTRASVAEIIEFGERLFSSIWEQEDFGIMSGDILKAYGSNIIKLSAVPELFTLQPVYDPMFLHQFKNCKCCWKSTWINVGDIIQSSSGVIGQTILIDGANLDYAGQGKAVAQIAASSKILSTDLDSPTPEIVIESTRLMPYFDDHDDAMWFVAGSEFPLAIKVWYINLTSGIVDYSTLNGGMHINSTQTTMEAYVANIIPRVTNFRYAPEYIYAKCGNQEGIDPGKGHRMWNIDNYAVLNNEDLHKMHQTALMSMLAVPSIAKV